MPQLNANQVADFFIRQADAQSGDVITHLKVQKLLYYAQGWHLALHDKPLFPEQIQAWAHGPVCPTVWRRFKDQNATPLTQDNTIYDGSELKVSERNFLSEVWTVYGQFTAKRLEEMTHTESPYLNARGNLAEYARSTSVISHAAMKGYFKSLKG
jgi:uncharacterized phage-associated protein